MGLDITAYSRLSLAEGYKIVDGDIYDPNGNPIAMGEYQTFFAPLINPGFPGRESPLQARVYRCDGDTHCFRAGSYGGYNHWREWLAALVDVTPRDLWDGIVTSCPFYDLINFSDCEGTIGATAAARLLVDFKTHEDRAGDDRNYRDFLQACELAADGGAIDFH